MAIVAGKETPVAREKATTPMMSASQPLSVAAHLHATRLARRGVRVEEALDEMTIGARTGVEDLAAGISRCPEK